MRIFNNKTFLILAGIGVFMLPWIEMPLHTHEIRHHNDCTACECSNHHTENQYYKDGLIKAPQKHNHDFHGVFDCCPICSILFE
ncbi:MAG: hypothetical protein ABIH42_10220, partial [Planctomycetota bacterium]